MPPTILPGDVAGYLPKTVIFLEGRRKAQTFRLNYALYKGTLACVASATTIFIAMIASLRLSFHPPNHDNCLPPKSGYMANFPIEIFIITAIVVLLKVLWVKHGHSTSYSDKKKLKHSNFLRTEWAPPIPKEQQNLALVARAMWLILAATLAHAWFVLGRGIILCAY